MTSFIPYIARGALILLMLAVIKLFNWPDITDYLVFIQDGVDLIYFMNPIMDLTTGFFVLKLILGIEIAYYAWLLLMALIHFMMTGSIRSGAGVVNEDEETI